MLFRSGYMIVTGIRHPADIDSAVDSVQCTLRTHASKSMRTNLVGVKTILATARMSRMLDPYHTCRIAAAYSPHILRAYWEPELCNAIVIQNHRSLVTVKIFPRTGSVTVFGKDIHQMRQFLTLLSRIII